MADDPQEGGTAVALFPYHKVREAALLPANLWPDERIRSIAKTVAPPNATVPDLAMFLAVADRYNLDPLMKEIWLAEDQGKLIVITGKDAILKKARESPLYLGHVSGLVHANDEFELEQLPDDNVRIHHKILGFPRGKLTGAYCIVRQNNRPPIWIVREIDDYAHLFSKKNWARYKPDMFLTRVVTAAHRLAFSLTGLYTPEDFIDGRLRPDEGENRPNDAPGEPLESMFERARTAQRTGFAGGRDVSHMRTVQAEEVARNRPAGEEPDFEIDDTPDQDGDPETETAAGVVEDIPDQTGAQNGGEAADEGSKPVAGEKEEPGAQNQPDQHTRALEDMKRKTAEGERMGPVEAMAAGARAGAAKKAAARKSRKSGKTKSELNAEYHAKVAELTDWGDGERKLWQEQRVGKASCTTWEIEDYELALVLLKRGDLDYERPLFNVDDPDELPV